MNAATPTASRKLTLTDIADQRAYERERQEFRARMIEVKRLRRVAIGDLLTVMFENRDTMRLQIQEMVRVEKLLTDEAVMDELTAYTPMMPEPGQLCATLFLALTSEEQVHEWLPKLAGLENSISLLLSDGSSVQGEIDALHAEGLTRDDVTAAVHYLTFNFTPEQASAFQTGQVSVVCNQKNYLDSTVLPDATRNELLSDLLP